MTIKSWVLTIIFVITFPLALQAMTIGDDILLFSGTPADPFITTVNSPSGFAVAINGNYNVNNSTYDGLAGLDVMLFSNLGDFLQASAVANVEIFQAGSGNDVLDLNGYTTSAIILGGLGDDIVFGGSLDDIVLGSGDNDFLDGGLGYNQIFGEIGNDTLIASLGNNVLDGGDGIDTIQFAPGVTLASLLNVEVISASTIWPDALLGFNDPFYHYGDLLAEYTNSNGMTGAFVARYFESVVLMVQLIHLQLLSMLPMAIPRLFLNPQHSFFWEVV